MAQTRTTQISPVDKELLHKMLNQSQEAALKLQDKQQEQQARQPKTWATLPQERREDIVLKALEMVLHGKEISPAVGKTLPPKLLKILEEQRSHLILSRNKALQPRLEMLVSRLRAKGLLDRPTKPSSPLDSLSPAQRKRQEAAEALELRRQNAIQYVEASKLLPRRTT